VDNQAAHALPARAQSRPGEVLVGHQACLGHGLKHLSAGVSKSPTELVPVRPVLEFSMVDPRFIAETDAMSAMDHWPNLLGVTPWEFEALISNLFTRMGLETRQTRASRDGGVDCIAWDRADLWRQDCYSGETL